MRSAKPGFVSFSFRLNTSPIERSIGKGTPGKESTDLLSMELPLNLTPGRLNSNCVSFAAEEECAPGVVKEDTPRLLSFEEATRAITIPRRNEGGPTNEESKAAVSQRLVDYERSGLSFEKNEAKTYHLVRSFGLDEEPERELQLPLSAREPTKCRWDCVEVVVAAQPSAPKEKRTYFVQLGGDVLDLIGEFLEDEIPSFAFTCRTLYRGLLEFKIENYALQEEMLAE